MQVPMIQALWREPSASGFMSNFMTTIEGAEPSELDLMIKREDIRLDLCN